jgi:hypothetical protein
VLEQGDNDFRQCSNCFKFPENEPDKHPEPNSPPISQARKR